MSYGEKMSVFTETAKRNLKREATAMMRLNHEGICRCHGIYFEQQDRFCWLVLELIKGQTLQELLQKESTGVFDEHRAIQAGCAILEALQEMHAVSLVHRDIKPGNVMLGQRRQKGAAVYKLIDLVSASVSALRGETGCRTNVAII